MSLTKQDLEDFVGRYERAAAASRGSLSPEIVKGLVDDIKEIKETTRVIPILTERVANIKVESDKVVGINTRLSQVEAGFARHDTIIALAIKYIVGLALTVLAAVGSFVIVLWNVFK